MPTLARQNVPFFTEISGEFKLPLGRCGHRPLRGGGKRGAGIAPRIFGGCGEFYVTDLDFWEKSAILKLTRVLPANGRAPR